MDRTASLEISRGRPQALRHAAVIDLQPAALGMAQLAIGALFGACCFMAVILGAPIA